MKAIALNIVWMLFAVAVVVVAVIKVDTFLKLKAYGDCANSSRYETVVGKATVSYPAQEIYKTCLKEKGY